MWVLGLSLNEIQALFSDCDLAVSHAALWRHGKELIRLLPEGRRSRLVELIPGESRDLITRASRTGAVVSLESGEAPRVVLELVDEADLTEVRSWLPPLLRNLGFFGEFVGDRVDARAH